MQRLIAALLFAVSVHAQPPVLAGGRLIDGYGGLPIENAVIAAEGNRIEAVGREGVIATPSGARMIDTNAKVVK